MRTRPETAALEALDRNVGKVHTWDDAHSGAFAAAY